MNKSNIIRTLAILVLVVLFIFYFLNRCNCSFGEKPGENPDSVFYWHNKANELTASLKGSKADFATMRQFYLDSIAKVYKTKTQYVESVVVVETQGETVLVPVDTSLHKEYELIVKPDCPPQIKSLSQKFNNQYYKADVKIGGGSYLKLQSFDTLTIVWKRVKSGGLFSRKNYLQIDAATANPYTKVTGLKGYRIADSKPKRIGIGLQGGYGFSEGIRPRAYIGIGITYSIIRL